MKKTIFAALALAAAGSTLAAATNPLAYPTAPVKEKSPYTYELGFATHRETYQEFEAGDKLMQEEALMTVIKGSIARNIGTTGGKVILAGEFGVGHANYTGAYWGGRYGDLVMVDLGRRLFEVTGMYKQTAPAWNGLAVGAGLGYRRLVDNLQQGGPGGYQRINDRTYLVLALEQGIDFPLWNVKPGVQYKHILSSKQKSEGLLGGVDVTQRHGHGAEASIAITQKGPSYNVVITPYVRVWTMGDSEVHRLGVYEPRNTTREAGLSVAYQF